MIKLKKLIIHVFALPLVAFFIVIYSLLCEGRFCKYFCVSKRATIMQKLKFAEITRSFPDEIPQATQSFSDSLHSKINRLEKGKDFARILRHKKIASLIAFISQHSPFLSRLILQYPEFFCEICIHGGDYCFERLKKHYLIMKPASSIELMREMRIAKSKASLLIAVCDIAGLWEVEKVTLSMSEIAEISVQRTLAFLLTKAAEKGEIKLCNPYHPEIHCGVFVLAMGKLGAGELNYSSDIDLIVFFEKEKIAYTGSTNVQHFLSKMTQEMVRMLQERTADGYVFRVDLRLRPDPASTPAAMSIAGAITYYETVGQNWERAAFIKARPIAGDMECGYQFLKQISPFIWRKNLDFAAIADIQSIKRQMDDRGSRVIQLAGHNIKTGMGGIREIEFYAQINQLIWGGRVINLRESPTCKTLATLASIDMIERELAEKLIASYRFLRHVEHRLQMIEDQQTHSIPTDPLLLEKLSIFVGYEKLVDFEQALVTHLNFVHDNFQNAFRGRSSLTADEGKLSFTGVENDPQTLETLKKMGYHNPASVSETIQSWHRGIYRSTRTKRARELITELTPTLLKSLTENPDPDQAFMRFDEFLSKLPSGIQLFSLFHINPELLSLISTIIGSAPAVAESLSKNPNLLDSVLSTNFYYEFAGKDALFNELSNWLLVARDFEDEINIIRRFKNEKQFQAGVQLIKHNSSAQATSHYLSDIADCCLEAMLHRVEIDFLAKHPDAKAGQLAIVVVGRLGAREFTFGSDIDIVFIYDDRLDNALLPPNHSIYNKLSQRFISSVTSLTNEGRLYEIDTRMRPLGNNGALAININAFAKYLEESAWTFELMAYTKARVMGGNKGIRKQIRSIIHENITRPRSSELLAQDIVSLRQKITAEYGSDTIWKLKYVHGGLLDLDFLAQYWVLCFASKNQNIITASTAQVFKHLVKYKFLDEIEGNKLIEAHHFLTSLFAILRLCGIGLFDPKTAPNGLKQLIARSVGQEDFPQVEMKLQQMIAVGNASFKKVIG